MICVSSVSQKTRVSTKPQLFIDSEKANAYYYLQVHVIVHCMVVSYKTFKGHQDLVISITIYLLQ